MAKYLASAEWKKFLKDQKDVKAPGIVMQLDAFAKAEAKKDLLEQIGALNELLDEVKATKGKHSKNKELVEYLDGMFKEANKTMSLVEALAAKQAKAQKEKEEEEDDEDEGEEQDDSKAINPELLGMVKRLKLAKSDAPMRFAVILRSAKEGSLALSKKKVTPDQIKEAKAGAGGGRIVARGMCFTEEGKSIFEVPKEVPASLGKAVRFFVFRDTGKKIKPIFRVRADMEDEGDETEGEESTGTTPRKTGAAVALAKLKIDWNQAKQRAGQQLTSLKQTIITEYDDAESADAAVRLDEILAAFNEGLSDSLDELYTAEEAQRAALRKKAVGILDNYLTFVNNSPLITHIEENPFQSVTIRETLSTPLAKIQTELAE